MWAIAAWYTVCVRIPRGYSTGKGASTRVQGPYHNHIGEQILTIPAPTSLFRNKARWSAAHGHVEQARGVIEGAEVWGGVSAFQEMKNKVVENAGWCRRSDVQQPQGYIDGTQAFEL